jgi:hypothetical protein
MYVPYVVILNLLQEIGVKTITTTLMNQEDYCAIDATLGWGTSEITLSTSSQQLIT